MMIEESELIETLDTCKSAILLEPEYKRRYPPLGLMKIASYLKNRENTPPNPIDIHYQRKYLYEEEDVIFITSLFTYTSEKVFDAINHIYAWNKNANIILGGVFASLMDKHINKKYPNVKIFKGYSKILDMQTPDYELDWGIEEPWDKYSFVFTTRGCPNNCNYCAVNKLEPDLWVNPMWKEHILPEKPYVMISDNNLSSQPREHLFDVVDFLVENKKKAIFDNGFDCKHIDDELAKQLAKLKYTRTGLRLAFDRIEEDGTFQNAIKTLLKNGARKSDLFAYILFNFNDTPKDAIYRAKECIKLGVRPYPQMYTPLNTLNRDNVHIGKHWSHPLTRAYRYFHLMAGIYRKHEFMGWIKTPDTVKKYKLTKEDFDLLC